MSQLVRLHGTPLSHYYNKIKIALLELGVPFEEVFWRPGDHWPDAGSPSGKVPFLTTPQGNVYESTAVVEYIDEALAQGSLYPRDPIARAHCRELILYIELYIERAVRPLYRALLKGTELSPATLATSLQEIRYGLKTLRRRVNLAPWLCGPDFTHADAAAWAHLTSLQWVLQKLGHDTLLTEAFPEFDAYYPRLEQRPSVQATRASLQAAQAQRQAAG